MRNFKVVSILILTLILSIVSHVIAEDVIKYEIAPGPYQGTEESLESIEYKCPEWYRDAKFGIWMHWGPQAMYAYGDWTARLMYVSDGDQFEQFFFDNQDKWNKGHWSSNIGGWEKTKGEELSRYHREHFGHQSEFGFKDVCNAWKAEKFDADQLMAIFKKAGAKYFAATGHHHDNFDLWNSKYHDWNSVRVGPHKDLVRMYKEAAAKEGLYFAVTLHPARTDWFSPARLMSDKEGPLKGVPYDGLLTKADGKGKWWEGLDPQELYGAPGSELRDYTAEEKYHYFLRVKDLIDNYDPDILYFDSGALPRDEAGINIAAHYFNSRIAKNGVNDGIITVKGARRYALPDVERGVVAQKYPNPWQTDTCIGNWYYTAPKMRAFKKPDWAIKILVDIVSKNGNLMLNIPTPASGEIDPRGLAFLDEMGDWMSINGEGLYGTRPWATFGEMKELAKVITGNHSENKLKYSADEYRFTKKGDTIYAFAMGIPQNDVQICALGKNAPFATGSVSKVSLLGNGDVDFEQKADALYIKLPATPASKHVLCFKIEGLKTNTEVDIVDAYYANEVELPVPAGDTAYTFNSLQYGDLGNQDGFTGEARIIPVDAARRNKMLIIDQPNTITRTNNKSWSMPKLTGKETNASISFDVNNPSYSRISVVLTDGKTASPRFGVCSGEITYTPAIGGKETLVKCNGVDVRGKMFRVKMVMNFITDTASVYCMNLSAGETEFTAVDKMQNVAMGLVGANPSNWNTMNIAMEQMWQEDRPAIIDNIEVLTK